MLDSPRCLCLLMCLGGEQCQTKESWGWLFAASPVIWSLRAFHSIISTKNRLVGGFNQHRKFHIVSMLMEPPTNMKAPTSYESDATLLGSPICHAKMLWVDAPRSPSWLILPESETPNVLVNQDRQPSRIIDSPWVNGSPLILKGRALTPAGDPRGQHVFLVNCSGWLMERPDKLVQKWLI